jgi:putative peptidoglycan lipid II flippase
VLSLARGLRPSFNWSSEHARTVISNFVPVFISRGVVQISAYVDSLIASFLPTGAVAALAYAQTIYLLPVSLFGMSISAAELPAMSSALGSEEEIANELRARLASAMRRVAFFVIPSVIAFVALGDVVIGAIYQTGRFTRDDTMFVWWVLAGSAIGLLATTLSRLYSSTFYALRDTRTPLKFAVLRVVLTIILGLLAALWLPRALNIDMRFGVAGLTASAGFAGWIEFLLLRSAAAQRIGRGEHLASHFAKLWICAAVAGSVGFAVKLLVGVAHPVVTAAIVLGFYGVAYLALTTAFGIPEARSSVARLSRKS